MDKPIESRSHSSADDKKSNQNPHLSDEQLLLTLDGESSVHEAAGVEAHLEACWSCRAHRERIEKAIGDVVEYRDYLTKPYFPVSTGGRAKFVALLEQLARHVGRPTLQIRIVRALRVFGEISQTVVPRHVWIGALVVASLAVFLLMRLWEVRRVSASLLLENAQISEVRALHSVEMPVVYQKLRIRVGSQAVTRTIYRDPVGMRQADRLDVADAGGDLASSEGLQGQPQDRPNAVRTADAELRRTFLTAHLNWQNPLSAASYSAWHDSLGEKQDEVTTVGVHLIALKTTTSEGPIAEACITVRTTDFHPVAEDLRLQDTRQVEVNELAWEVLPMEAINLALFAPEATPSADVGRPSNVVPLPPGPTDTELAEAELRARVAIHAEKADLGEQIELDRDTPRSGQRSVVVRGIVSTAERRNDLLAILRGIPHVELRLQTVEEARLQQNQFAAAKSSEDTAPQISQEAVTREYRVAGESVEATGHETPAVAFTGKPALEQQLEELVPIDEDRAAFINATVELLQDAMAQAWALRRLGNRYTPDMVAELSSGSRQTLELLIRDHVSALHQCVDGVRNGVLPLLPAVPATAVPPPPMPDAALPAAALAGDWRSTVSEVFLKTQRVHDDGAALLAGSVEAASETKAIVRDLQLALAELETQIPALYQQVSEPFLSEPKNKGR